MSTGAPTSAALGLSSADLPALHAAADTASLGAQRRYLWLTQVELVFLVVGAALSSASAAAPAAAKWLAVAGGIVLVASLVMAVIIRAARPEDTWYGGRAMAESVKTLAWRYATCAEPFKAEMGSDDARHLLRERLSALLLEGDRLSLPLLTAGDSGAQVTPAMEQLRRSPMEDRKAVYLRDRIKDQRDWYMGRARVSDLRQNQFFVAIVVAQAAAVAFSFLAAFDVLQTVSLASAFSAVAAALVAWLQVRRHQEQAKSYAITAHELGLIEIEAQRVTTEERFSEFVSDAESAVSREHILWIARRDARLALTQRRS